MIPPPGFDHANKTRPASTGPVAWFVHKVQICEDTLQVQQNSDVFFLQDVKQCQMNWNCF